MNSAIDENCFDSIKHLNVIQLITHSNQHGISPLEVECCDRFLLAFLESIECVLKLPNEIL